MLIFDQFGTHFAVGYLLGGQFWAMGRVNLLGGQFWAMVRVNLLGGQINLLGGQILTQLTCYLPPCDEFKMWVTFLGFPCQVTLLDHCVKLYTSCVFFLTQ